MTDQALTDALRKLGIDADSYRILTLLPLVHVAWSDGEVQRAERSLILRLARERELVDDEGLKVLGSWLKYRPSAAYLQRGHDVLVELAQRSGHMGIEHDLDEIVGFCEDVARAAGGLFGIRSISPVERATITEIAQALHTDPSARSWDALLDDLEEAAADVWDDDDEITDIVEVSSMSSESVSVARVAAPGAALVDIHSGKRFAIGERATIGRSRANDIHIGNDGRISRAHCVVERRGSRFFVRDNDSSNGTLVNGERVGERQLFGGDDVQVGQTLFRFEA